jgi:DNA-binding Lrp family transcriptional regulator
LAVDGGTVTFKNRPLGGPSVEGAVETIYLLVVAEVGRLEEILRRLQTVPGVAEVQAVTGPFDLIVKVEAPHINAALDIVIQKIRKIPGIKATETLVTVGH